MFIMTSVISIVAFFVFPSLEFSMAGCRSVDLASPFLNHENGDFSILMRDIYFDCCIFCPSSRGLCLYGESKFCKYLVRLLSLLFFLILFLFMCMITV
jgi:hypothetical protein